MLTEIPLQHRVLRHLIDENMQSRRNQIIDANPDTCRWILEDSEEYLEASESDSDSNGGSSPYSPSDADSDADSGSIQSSASVKENPDWEAELQHRCEIRSKFIQWLANGQDILHVSGNAGSGKSTLMKFIAQHERTIEELEAWAGTKQLIFSQFYFWAAGTESQQSMQGLYRSLLFQTLSQCPELIEKVFCDQVDRMRRSGAQVDPAVERMQGFDDAQVRDAFELLLNQAHDANYRMCFLLDGLDEFKGKPLEHENLALKLESWTLDGSVKLLVSSRPWPEFENVFVANDTIYLHQLNHFDIKTYCFERLEQDREYNQIRGDEDMLDIEAVVDDIVSGSQGIFLWAHLVLDNILQGVRQRDSITTLRAKVQEYPADLDSLYDKLREPIEKSPIDRNRANRMLLLALHAPDKFCLPAIAFSWILDDSKTGLLNPEFPTDNTCRPYTEAKANKRIQRVTKQLNSLTRGLLELDQSQQYKDRIKNEPLNFYFMSPGVTFCHKSARDYLVLNEARYQKLCASWPIFHDTDVYGRIHLARLLYGASIEDLRIKGEWSPRNRYLNRMKHPYCQSFDPKTIRKFELPLRPFLRGLVYLPVVGANDTHEIESEPSFLQWCAWCGLDTFVLAETIQAPAHIHSVGSSILPAIMFHVHRSGDLGRMDVFLQLLDRRIGFDVMIEMLKSKKNADAIPWKVPPLEETFYLPTWVVVYWMLLDNMVFAIPLGRGPKKGDLTYDLAVAGLRCLFEYGEQIGERLAFTLGIEENTKKGSESSKVKERFSAAEIVEWLEEECTEVRRAIPTSSTADQAQWSWWARTADGNESTSDVMQHRLGGWLIENKPPGYRPHKRWWDLQVCVVHWQSVDLQLNHKVWSLGNRLF